MFSNIKVGDKVVFHSWGINGNNHIFIIKKVIEKNKRTFKIENSSYSFLITNGEVWGNGMSTKRRKVITLEAYNLTNHD